MTKKSISVCDQEADVAIDTMVKAVLATSVLPVVVNTGLTGTAMGAGCIAIGKVYGISLSDDDAWKLIKQFFLGAGTWFLAMNFGSKFLTMLIQATGIGYLFSVAIDATISAAAAYAIGSCAKAYFRNDYMGRNKPTKEELGRIFREQFKKHKQ